MKRTIGLALIVVMILTSASFSVFADAATEVKTVSITPIEDTYIFAGNNAENAFSEEKQLLTNQRTDDFRREAYVKFDLDTLEIPKGSTINNAKLSFYVEGGTATHILVYEYFADVDFSSLTANNAPARGVEIKRIEIPADTPGVYELDITSYIQALEDVSGKIAFAVNGTNNKYLTMTSSEGDANNAPKLTVSYTSIPVDIATPVLLMATEDTYVFEMAQTTNYSGESQLQANNVTNGYFREAYVKFNLDEIEIPEGFEIGSVVFTANNCTTYGTATEAAIWPISKDVKINEITYETKPSKGDKIGAASFAEKTKGTFEIDITEYVKAYGVSGDIAFAINGTANKSLYLSSLEGDSSLAPCLTVTFVKASEKTEDKIYVDEIAAISVYNAGLKDTSVDAQDVVYTPYANADGKYTLSTANDTDLCDVENRYVMMRFDISSLEIPEGKVIKSAVLKAYFMKNFAQQPVVLEAVGMSNTSFDSDKLTYNNQPATDGNYIGHCTIDGSETSNVVNAYCELDMTPYFTQCLYTSKDALAFAMHMSGAHYRITDGKTGSVEMKACDENGMYNPYIEITYGEATDGVSIGETTLYNSRYNAPVAELSSGRVVVDIPVVCAGDEVKTYNVYLAAYSKANPGKLLGAFADEISFASANGTGATAIFDTGSFDEAYTWKAFVWENGVKPANAPKAVAAPQN